MGPTIEQRPSRLLRVCGLLVLLPILSLYSSPAQTPSGHLRTLRTVSEVFAIGKAEAAKAYPIELDAIVLYSDPEWGSLFVQDRTGPTYVDAHGIGTKYPTGARVRVYAVTGVNQDGPMLAHSRIVVLGRGAAPKPVQKSVAELEGGNDESFMAFTEGRLHPCERDYFRVCFRIFDGKKAVWLFVPQPDSPAAQSLMGALVRVQGVIGRHVDEANQRLGAQFYVNSLDGIKVLEPPAVAGFSSPPMPIGELRPAEAEQRFVGQVHLRGTVTWQSPGLFSLQDRSGLIFVGTRKDAVVHSGKVIDAVGFPSRGEFGLELADSAVRLANSSTNEVEISPLQSTAAEVLKHGLGGRRVHLKARLIGQSADAGRFVYQLESRGVRFSAVLLKSDANRETVGVAPGSVLELTGVALIQRGRPEEPASLLVLIESPADMVAQGSFAWLTLRRGLMILGGIAFCILVPLAWVTVLRRTVRRQTAIIRKRLESELQLETKFRRLFERNLAGVFSWRPGDGVIVDCNPAFAATLGFEAREELIGRSFWEILDDPAHREALLDLLRLGALSNRDATLVRGNGTAVHLLMNITPVEAEDGPLYETTAIDVTLLRQNQAALQKAKEKAEYESLYDALTGLPNRRHLLEQLSHALARARSDGSTIAVLFIDLDRFKLVNDSLGHPTGDALLVQIARSLRSGVRETDLLARLGGDEFMVILDGLHDREEAALVAEDLLQAISRPQQVKGHELTLGASIGISVFPDEAGNAEQLIQQADNAMYAAKREGRNRVLFFTSEMGSRVQERQSLEQQLRSAIARQEIFVHYQPEFEVASNNLVCFEALARWTHPVLGQSPPDKFIPIAEESGMISALGAFIMEQACREAVRWQKLRPYPIRVAVNVSSIQFSRKGFVEEVGMVLERTGLRPELLQIELTESVMLNGAHSTTATMNRLRCMGIGLVIDDFGTGYSNLSYLPSLPFDALKIDRSFIVNMETMPESESMIRTLIALAGNIGMEVIVEGIEEPQQRELIKALGANGAQGFMLGRPTANPIEVFLRAAEAEEPLPTAPAIDALP